MPYALGVDVYLVDGTYELFRYFFALPAHVNPRGREVAAVRGVLGSMLGMLEGGVTHLGVATDHVIESFRNDMWPGYKTGEGVDPRLLGQFALLEDGLRAMGVAVWPMVELEADDALASAAALAEASPQVDHVYICSPDKDLGQCLRDRRVLQLDRRSGKVTDVEGIVAKFGVPPASIPDYLALAGDSADGYPGLPGWGARSAAAVLSRFGSLDAVPDDAALWQLPLRGAERLAQTLREQRDLALLFRELARLRTDAPLFSRVEEIAWSEPTPELAAFCRELDAPQLAERATLLSRQRRSSG
jgi:5'-3' exonuclease